MAEVLPLKLVDLGSGQGALEEFDTGDKLPKSLLPALASGDISGLGTAALRDAIGAGDVFARGGILGTVSQSGGVPTGAIIQSNSGASGRVVRYANGWQECEGSISIPAGGWASSAGVRYLLYGPQAFPATFVGPVTVVVSPRDGDVSARSAWVTYADANETGIIQIAFGAGPSTTGAGAFIARYHAVGRWFA